MKKLKKAAALKYEEGYNAPIVTAAGAGYCAEKILDIAKENDVPIVFNEELANLMQNINIGDEIPEKLYGAVAEILVYVMDIDKKVGNRR